MDQLEKEQMVKAQQFDDNRFTKINMIRTNRSMAFMLNFLPGQHMKPHNHPDRELYLLVIEGGGTLSIDGNDVEVEKGDVILCDAEEQIGFTNTSDQRVSIYATMTKLKN